MTLNWIWNLTWNIRKTVDSECIKDIFWFNDGKTWIRTRFWNSCFKRFDILCNIQKRKKHNILSLWIFRRHLKDFLGSRFEIYFVKNIHPVQNFGEQVGPNHNWLLGSEQYFINIWCFKLLFHCRFPHNVSHEISVCSSLIGFSVKGNKKIARIRNVFWNVLKSESGNAIL